MLKSARLRSSDLRAIWELVNECRELGDDYARWNGHLLRSLGRVMGADFIVGGDVGVQSDGRVLGVNPIVWGWENGFNQGAFQRALTETETEISTSPLVAAYFRRPEGADGAGMLRSDLLSDHEWYPTPFFARIQSAIGIDHSLV